MGRIKMKLKELLSDINAKDEVVATYDKNKGIVYIYESGSEDTSDSFGGLASENI